MQTSITCHETIYLFYFLKHFYKSFSVLHQLLVISPFLQYLPVYSIIFSNIYQIINI
jgi:hypothetical protein